LASTATTLHELATRLDRPTRAKKDNTAAAPALGTQESPQIVSSITVCIYDAFRGSVQLLVASKLPRAGVASHYKFCGRMLCAEPDLAVEIFNSYISSSQLTDTSVIRFRDSYMKFAQRCDGLILPISLYAMPSAIKFPVTEKRLWGVGVQLYGEAARSNRAGEGA
jgi:hypothetical protein